MASKQPRIPLNPGQAGLNSAFAGLSLSGLPEGPAEPPAAAASSGAPKPGRVVLRRETSGRGGKTVIVVDDFAAHFTGEDLEALARKLQRTCGCGGSVKGRTIELQGDQPGKIRAALETDGFRVAGVR
jgi:translation initiation factor 1